MQSQIRNRAYLRAYIGIVNVEAQKDLKFDEEKNDLAFFSNEVNVLNNMRNYYELGPGQKQYLGTGWGAYNAVTGYYSNVDNAEGIKRFDKLVFGSQSVKIQTAGNLIAA